MPEIQDIGFLSSLSGLGNYGVKTASMDVPSITVSGFSGQNFTLDIPLDRDDNISQVQFRCLGLENVWRIASSNVLYRPNFLSAQDAVQINADFQDDLLTMRVRVVDATNTSHNTVAFTFEVKVFLFVAPFPS